MKNLKLAARETEQRTIINVSNVAFGRDFVVIAGPCSIESEFQIIETARYFSSGACTLLLKNG